MFMKKRDEKGFTLIELMIVIAIIGILAAIAIPNFNAYRARSYNASANTDMRNLQTSMEGYFVDYGNYPTTADAATDLDGYGYVRSAGVVVGAITGNDTGYTIALTQNTKAGPQDRAVSYSISNPEEDAIQSEIP